MNLLVWDHVLVAWLVVGVPLLGRRAYRKLQAKPGGEGSTAMRREYGWTLVLEWGIAAAVLGIWALAGRPWAALGLGLGSPGQIAVGVAATAAVFGFLVYQWIAVKRADEPTRAALRAQVASAEAVIPRTDREHQLWRAVAVTAGICEELAYRGYLIAYVAVFAGTWGGAVLSALVFGACHAYQGRAGMLKTGLVGLGAGFLYVGTGSLVWPVVLHAAVDLHGGAIGRVALSWPEVPSGEASPRQ